MGCSMNRRVKPLRHMNWLFLASLACSPSQVYAQVDAEYYSRRVAPLLREKCVACHGPVRQEAGLRLDTAHLVKKGSDEGTILDPEHPDKSKILARVLASTPAERMPPEGEGVALKSEEASLIREWIANGMPAPEKEQTLSGPDEHWAFQPIRRNLPIQSSHDIQSKAKPKSPIDTLMENAQKQQGLVSLPAADRATLLRRITLDLTGLPPSSREMDSFLSDGSDDVFEHEVDRLLSRPAYGERWGRHWMDIWRYSDWDGYKEELRGSQRNIWHWRDWIIESLNRNKPYDQMIVEMLAADELDPLNQDSLRATGFLARNYHRSNRNIWLDATVEHTAKAFLGLTINCAKCHDHKYDPISQLDYYRFRAIFEPHQVRTDPVYTGGQVATPGIPRVYDADLSIPTYLFARGDEKHPFKEKSVEASIPLAIPVPNDYRISSRPLPQAAVYPELQPAAEKFALEAAWKKCDDARGTLDKAFERKKKIDLGEIQESADSVDSSYVLLKLREAEASLVSLQTRYQAEKEKHTRNDERLSRNLAEVALASEQRWNEIQVELRVFEAHRGIAAAESSKVKDEKKRTAVLAKAKKELADALESQSKLLSADAAGKLKAYTPIVRGYPKESTGRRTALSQWIVDRRNPLTARVAVNHIWARHFGTPLVDDVFDFGMKTPKPELIGVLDFLAAELMDSGWDMKHLHRMIVCSQTYQRASSGPVDLVTAARKIDPDNRYYWRGNVRRLDAEEIRDSVLAVGQFLDETMGGPDIDEEQGEKSMRRSVYFRHAYEKQMTMMVMFDAASPTECYRRRPSIIPQQALVLANSPLARSSSRKLASRLWQEAGRDQTQFIIRLFAETLNRTPSSQEIRECEQFLGECMHGMQAHSQAVTDNGTPTNKAPTNKALASEGPATDASELACQSLAHVLLNHNDFVSVR